MSDKQFKPPTFAEKILLFGLVAFFIIGVIAYTAPLWAVLLYPIIGEISTERMLEFIELYRGDILLWFALIFAPVFIIVRFILNND